MAVRYKTQMNLTVHSDFSIYNLEISDFEAYCAKLKNLVFKSRSNQCDSLGFGLGFDLITAIHTGRRLPGNVRKDTPAPHPVVLMKPFTHRKL